MRILSFRIAALALVAGSLSACAYDNYGYGYGAGYGGGFGGYGGHRPYASSVTLSYGNYYGWNDGYYYPGVGYQVYDRYRRPHRWNYGQQRYWGDRQRRWRGHHHDGFRSNWSGYRRDRR